MADHYQGLPSHHGRPEQRLRDPFYMDMRDPLNNFPSHFMQGSPQSNPGLDQDHLFRSPRRNFPSHGNFEDAFSRGFKVPDHPGQFFNRSETPGNVVESIPIKVIHEKSNASRASHSPPQRPHTHQHHPFTGSRQTTEIPLPSSGKQQQSLHASPRLERAHSEPPKSFHQRLSSSLHPPGQQTIPEQRTEEDPSNPIMTSASAPSVPGDSLPKETKKSSPVPPTPPPPPQASSQGADPNPQPQIRHIPIVVEGRDAPVFSRKVSDPTTKPSESSQQPQKQYKEPTTPLGPPPGPIPMGCSADHLKPMEEPSSPLPCPDGPIPLPCSPNLLQKEAKKEETVPLADATDGKEPSSSPSKQHPQEPQDPALEKVKSIQNNLAEITRRIEGFKGSKKDKEYLYLDEMLTRHLLSLDGIDSGGKEDIRKARKESIKSVNRCLSLLDSKAGSKS
eukprot:TRINITY_DN2710_c0_g2_i1.p1 TRINITY_DN2710_c0_g2~~TRINITY_DN2710_c0_g2_i1.p1  ORF type:complete len:448 (+),score=131.78 TRINITY_DN2710_c0_g2_i1:499-1842(+)